MDIQNLRSRIAFLDVEASGVMDRSFPVEVAWRTNEGDGSVLINPDGVWDETRWDSDAEDIHGLTPPFLRRNGRRPREAAAALERAMGGKTAFTDSPAHDVEWIDMLHGAGGVRRTYRVESIGRLLGHLGVRASRAFEIFEAARMSHPPRGRAHLGVAHLGEVFEAAVREFRP